MISMTSFTDELVKIAALGQAAGAAKNVIFPFLKAHAKPIGFLGAGGATALAGKRAIDDIMAMESLPAETRKALLARAG